MNVPYVLQSWQHLSDFVDPAGCCFEWPRLFPLFVDGDVYKPKWVLVVSVNWGGPQEGSGSRYYVGSFDGTRFEPDEPGGRYLDYGKDYTGVGSWAGGAVDGGQQLMLGWMGNWQYSKQKENT